MVLQSVFLALHARKRALHSPQWFICISRVVLCVLRQGFELILQCWMTLESQSICLYHQGAGSTDSSHYTWLLGVLFLMLLGNNINRTSDLWLQSQVKVESSKYLIKLKHWGNRCSSVMERMLTMVSQRLILDPNESKRPDNNNWGRTQV